MKVNAKQLAIMESVIANINRVNPGSTLRIENMRLLGPERLIEYVKTKASSILLDEMTQAFPTQVISYPLNGETYTIELSKDGSYFMTRKLDIGGITQVESTLPLETTDFVGVTNISEITAFDVENILIKIKARGRTFGL